MAFNRTLRASPGARFSPVIFLLTLLLTNHNPVESLSFSRGGDAKPLRCAGDRVNDDSFSLSGWRMARAAETAAVLDATRWHFQILFVDDNARGRIAAGLLERVAEHNDALFILFPSSATTGTGFLADSTAPSGAVSACASLGLCPTRSAESGTSFDAPRDLGSYDLVIAMDDSIRSSILNSLPCEEDRDFYGPRCRLLSEFLSKDFCCYSSPSTARTTALDMLDGALRDRVAPFDGLFADDHAATSGIFDATPGTGEGRLLMTEEGTVVANAAGWPLAEAATVVAAAGVARFCLDTMDVQVESAFRSILDAYFSRAEHLDLTWDEADERIRRAPVSGWFSPLERKSRFEAHRAGLERKLAATSPPEQQRIQ